MISIDRTLVVEPASLNLPNRSGFTETQRAIEHYEADNWDRKKAFEYKRYSEDEVRVALRTLFADKCAYCESRFAFVCPEDIEHWRPKGSVILGDGTERKPGYYWLGASWSNLLLSCIHCNRRCRHKDARDPSVELTGKQSFFPVFVEANRWTDRQMGNVEVALLLDPCQDNPDDYLRIDDEGIVHEKRADDPWNQRAKASIEIYGLNRIELVNERKEHISRVVALINDVKREIRYWRRTLDENERREHRDVISEKLRLLEGERGNSSPYLFAKRSLIDGCIMEIGPDLSQMQLA